MAYITREDGERFVIPSYRDVLSAKRPALLRREILLLSSNYGEYITLQRKNVNQYEVAFSPDPGYLLGETVWHYFKRPQDLIYCEAIPNTSEAILVIVKAGSVYLDGTFPLDAISDELVIFLTQQNNFEIYVYGDVPISKTPEEGKFSLSANSVKSFTVLDEPVFPLLPLVKAFQLLPVQVVLKAKGIGVFPTRLLVLGVLGLGLLWLVWILLTTEKKELPQVFVESVNPYQGYIAAMSSPDPVDQIHWVATTIRQLLTIPGWFPDSTTFAASQLRTLVFSKGVTTDILFDWAKQNNASIEILPEGFYVVQDAAFVNRQSPSFPPSLTDTVAKLADNVSYILRGNVLTIGTIVSKGRYIERDVSIKFDNITPATLDSVGQKLKNLSLVLTSISIKITNGNVSGTITLKALGS